mmetsp:Transcript_7583/g.19301  ORF Transcript_7583/g.19301 Transcript_7583/m.19301 type:complete len:315 (+) Transcript_7583:261-1205(+)
MDCDLLLLLLGALVPVACDVALLLVLICQLLGCSVLCIDFFLLLLVQDITPFFEELRGLRILSPLALTLRLLPRDLSCAALLDVILPPLPCFLFGDALGLVGCLLFSDLALHSLVLVVLHFCQALGLCINHRIPGLLLLLEDLVFLRLPQHQHLLLPDGVLLDLLLLPLLPQHVFSLDLLQVLVGFLSLLHGLDRCLASLALSTALTVEVLDCLAAEELALEHLILDLPEPLLLVLGQLLLLRLRCHLLQLLLGLLLLHLTLEHPAVVLLLHLQEAIFPDLLQLLQLTLQAHLGLPLRKDVAHHHLAVERLHAV